MNLQKKNIWVVFLTSFFFTIWMPALFPQCRLFFFAPFIVILFYKKRFITCLWGALFCGLFVDLLSSLSHLGIHALNYTLTTGVLYRQRRHFFADSPTTLPIMVYLFSLTCTAIQLPLLYMFEQKLSISWEWIRTDLIVMPILDSLFVFFLYIFPFWMFGKTQLKGEDYFTQEGTPS